MKLIAYPTTTQPCIIRPANSKREWMDVATNKNPYRCLPLSMANSWGWEIISTAKFTAEWNGGQGPHDVKVTMLDGHTPPSPHFGEGTLTWHSGYTFRTPYPYGLYVTGAPNYPKPNVIPLSGVVETHWLAYTFTMNWRFTQPGTFTMDIGEPFCQIFPVNMDTFDEVEPEIHSMTDDKEFYDRYWDWNISRQEYLTEQNMGMHDASVWQKHYFQGTNPPDRRKCPVHINKDREEKSDHRTKPNVPEFTDKQTTNYKVPDYYQDRLKEVNEKHKLYMEKRQEEQKVRDRIIRMETISKRLKQLKESKEKQKNFMDIPVAANQTITNKPSDDVVERKRLEIEKMLLESEK